MLSHDAVAPRGPPHCMNTGGRGDMWPQRAESTRKPPSHRCSLRNLIL